MHSLRHYSKSKFHFCASVTYYIQLACIKVARIHIAAQQSTTVSTSENITANLVHSMFELNLLFRCAIVPFGLVRANISTQSVSHTRKYWHTFRTWFVARRRLRMYGRLSKFCFTQPNDDGSQHAKQWLFGALIFVGTFDSVFSIHQTFNVNGYRCYFVQEK